MSLGSGRSVTGADLVRENTSTTSRCTRAEPETPGEGTRHDGMREEVGATPNTVVGMRNTAQAVGEGGEGASPVKETPRGIQHGGTNPVSQS